MIFFSRSENQINIHDYLQSSINNSGDLVKDLLFFCKDGSISSYQLVFASLSDFLQSEFKLSTHDKSISILLVSSFFIRVLLVVTARWIVFGQRCFSTYRRHF